MAASGRTARRLLDFFKTTDAPTIAAWSEALANQLDNDVEYHQGTLAARPAAALSGRMYLVQGDATPANNGVLWVDNGTTWVDPNESGLAEQGYTHSKGMAYGAGGSVTPSTARPCYAVLILKTNKLSTTIDVEVGGVFVGCVTSFIFDLEGEVRMIPGSLGFYVPPGATVSYPKETGNTGVAELRWIEL